MLCLAGTFRILSTEPDGDSIRFYADDSAAWARVAGPNAVRTNAGGGGQLRLGGFARPHDIRSPRAGLAGIGSSLRRETTRKGLVG